MKQIGFYTSKTLRLAESQHLIEVKLLRLSREHQQLKKRIYQLECEMAHQNDLIDDTKIHFENNLELARREKSAYSVDWLLEIVE